MSRRDYTAAVRAAKELNEGLRAGDVRTPLVSPYTKGHKAGNGRAAEKTLTQAVKSAEAARDEAQVQYKAAHAACLASIAAKGAAEKLAAQADEVCVLCALLAAALGGVAGMAGGAEVLMGFLSGSPAVLRSCCVTGSC